MQEKIQEIFNNPELIQGIHQVFSGGCFNACWNFIDNADRSPEDEEDMILLANTSLYHWKKRKDATPTNLSVGYWQSSRVYALAGQYEMAMVMGRKCLKVGLENTLPAFYVGYAYEALARAELLNNDKTSAGDYLAEADKQLTQVTGKDEKELLKADVDALKDLLST